MKKALLYVIGRTIDGLVSLLIVTLLVGIGVYATGSSSQITNYLGTGLDAIEYTNGNSTQSISSDTYYSKNNGTWLGYYGNNYIRSLVGKTTYLKGTLTSEDNTNYYINLTGNSNFNGVCINGTCKTNWPPALGASCNANTDSRVLVSGLYADKDIVPACYNSYYYIFQCRNGTWTPAFNHYTGCP